MWIAFNSTAIPFLVKIYFANNQILDNMEKIKIKIRILPSGKEVMVGVPEDTLGNELITAVLNKPDLNLDRKDSDGKLLQYELSCKETARPIAGNQSLKEAGVKKDNQIMMSPTKFVAG